MTRAKGEGVPKIFADVTCVCSVRIFRRISTYVVSSSISDISVIDVLGAAFHLFLHPAVEVRVHSYMYVLT